MLDDNVTLGLPDWPDLVVIKITPLLALKPYIACAAVPFKIVIDAISF